MNEPIIQGWCPGALRPMASADGLVVRVRTRLARLGQAEAAEIAQLSKRYGNGQIDISARANVQLRGVSEATHPPLIDGLRALGVIDESIAIETRRNIVLTPFWRAGDDSHRIATALMAALARSDAPVLPGKFGFAVDCGDTPILGDISADIRIERGADGQLICRADSAAKGMRVTTETAADAALALAHWFAETGGITNGRGRMAAHLKKALSLPEPYLEIDAFQPTTPYQPQIGRTPLGYLAGLEFGRITADSFAALAALGPIRVTPWRMVLIEDLTEPPALPDLITDPDDPRLRIYACTGAPDCPQAHGPTRAVARNLAARLGAKQSLHVSGCAKGCAHPNPMDLTILTTGNDSFDLILNGSASNTPDETGLSARNLMEHPAFGKGNL